MKHWFSLVVWRLFCLLILSIGVVRPLIALMMMVCGLIDFGVFCEKQYIFHFALYHYHRNLTLFNFIYHKSILEKGMH